MRITLSRLGPDDRQKTLPDAGSSHARSKWTPSSRSIARSRSWASWSWVAVTPTNPLWTSMNFAIGTSIGAARLTSGRLAVDSRRRHAGRHRPPARWGLPKNTQTAVGVRNLGPGGLD